MRENTRRYQLNREWLKKTKYTLTIQWSFSQPVVRETMSTSKFKVAYHILPQLEKKFYVISLEFCVFSSPLAAFIGEAHDLMPCCCNP
jgi:hypothetical protein